MIERERDGLRGDPDREAKAWADKLAEGDHKRALYQDIAAESLINFDELRTKLAALEETRKTARQELAAVEGRREQLAELERDRILVEYVGMVPEALDTLSAEERHQGYKMLRLRVFAYPDGSLWRGAECSVRTLAFVKKKRYILAYDPQDVRGRPRLRRGLRTRR